jgi:hypothetical protein
MDLLQDLKHNPERSLLWERRYMLCCLHAGQSPEIDPQSELIAQEQPNSLVWKELAGLQDKPQAKDQPQEPIPQAVQPEQPGPQPVLDNPADLGQGTRRGRNDPCPCGSGKKAKNCCGVAVWQKQGQDSSLVQ